MEGDIRMSIKELRRIDIVERLVRRELKQNTAAELLGISVRQVKRLVHRYKKEGISSLVHKSKGKPGNHQIDQHKLNKAVAIVKDQYWDFGPTLAHEKLVEHHDFSYSLSTLRQALMHVGLWQPTRRKKAHIHQLRERRACFGELWQLDGSSHDWFEDRGPKCNLNVAIDDATGIHMLEFSPSETTQDYFRLMEKQLLAYGIPAAVYVDKHSIFHISYSNAPAVTKPIHMRVLEGYTQFGRALHELGITVILANSPQAKGRVENINKTLQDRLVKELRLRNISTIPEANAYLPEFTQAYCMKFAQTPRSSVDMHRKVPADLDLTKILCVQESRILSKNLLCQYQNTIYQMTTTRSVYALRNTRVTIRERADGSVTIWDTKEHRLEYTTIAQVQKPKEADSKLLNQLIDAIVVKQANTKKNPWESDAQECEEENLLLKPQGDISM